MSNSVTPWTAAGQTPVHGILQERILEWPAISFSRGSSRLMDQIQVSCIADRPLEKPKYCAQQPGTRKPEQLLEYYDNQCFLSMRTNTDAPFSSFCVYSGPQKSQEDRKSLRMLFSLTSNHLSRNSGEEAAAGTAHLHPSSHEIWKIPWGRNGKGHSLLSISSKQRARMTTESAITILMRLCNLFACSA